MVSDLGFDLREMRVHLSSVFFIITIFFFFFFFQLICVQNSLSGL